MIRRGAVARARRRGVAVIDCAVSAPLDRRCAPAESQVYFKTGPDRAWTDPDTVQRETAVSARWGAGPVDWAGWRRGGRARARPWRLTFFRFYVHVHVVCACTPCSVCDGRDSCLLVFGCRRSTPAYMAQWLPSRRGRCRFRHGTVSIGMTDPRRSGAAGRRGGAVPRHCSHTHTLASST